MDLIRTYTPEDVSVYMFYTDAETGGQFNKQITGWNRISVTRSSPAFRQIRGIRGSSSRVRTLDRSWIMKLSLDQTSKSNYDLFQVLRLDAANLSKTLVTFLILDDSAQENADKDSAGEFQAATGYQAAPKAGTTIESATCYIESMPDLVWDNDTTDREWTIIALQSTAYYVGYSGVSLRENLLSNPSGVLSAAVGAATNALKTVGSGLSNITQIFK